MLGVTHTLLLAVLHVQHKGLVMEETHPAVACALMPADMGT